MNQKVFPSITLTAVGVTLTNILNNDLRALGVLLIAAGGYFFIKHIRKERNNNN